MTKLRKLLIDAWDVMFEERVWFSEDDLKKLQELPVGAVLYVKVTTKPKATN